jgi:hypothetical protein
MKHKKFYLLVSITLLLIISITITIKLAQQKQETRSSANNASATLVLTPNSSTTNPIQKNVGDSIPLDIAINPGDNLVTFVRFQVKYDPTKVSPHTANPFAPNIAAFPSTIEGPASDAGTIAASVSVGSDPTKAIQKPTTVGTLNFKAIGGTGNTPTQITFTTLTQVLSAGSGQQASENILSSTTPATIAINGQTATPSGTLSPMPTGNSTTLEINLLLHGVGAAGDNPNPKGSNLSNKNPLHPQRDLSVTIIDSNNQPIGTQSGSIVYDNDQGNFTTSLNLGPSFPTGNYSLKIKSDRYLRKQTPGIITITNLKKNTAPQTALVAGDVKSDNVLNILDYNILLDCGYGEIEPLPIADANSTYFSKTCASHDPYKPSADLDDNGTVNSHDYNLFLRELSVQTGD